MRPRAVLEFLEIRKNASAGIRTPGHEARSIDAILHSLPGVFLGTAVAQWLRCCATNRKVAGSIPDGAI